MSFDPLYQLPEFPSQQQLRDRRTQRGTAPDDYIERVGEFKQRTFTGAEVLAIADFLGCGVGATLAAAKRVDMMKPGS